LSFNIEELIEDSDNDLLKKVQNRIHCLSSLLPPCNPANYRFNLRPRGHDLPLPFIKKAVFKNSFLCEFSISTNSLFIIEYVVDIY